MQFIYKQLRLGFLGLFFVGLLAACQSTPEVKSPFNAEQIATLKDQGFRQTEDGWELSFTDKLLFDFGASSLTAPSRSAILKISAALLKVGIIHMRVEGHTDNEGAEVLNNKLSLARANAVADAMGVAGIARGNIVVNGLGMSKPVASNATKAGQAENRRVTVIVSAP
ncbi:outer membrane protein OmpA-like peptidoglycan-associated protein [Janthinobacterium sp. 67]|uniref:OmpA family protein n=1 Tax=Janthinobacterium sp. 67 TaxID=2035207 RepID=UPI000C23AF94|nr:OmpA family protein [Janthinobacterium sp. 67]PJJ17119.1 outer membrane protein OmpA-like peptidoglycan-associated protein [Janthinobacterium sp. 67]